MLTAKGIRDRVDSIRTCKIPDRQTEMLFQLLEDIAQAVGSIERLHELSIKRLQSELDSLR